MDNEKVESSQALDRMGVEKLGENQIQKSSVVSELTTRDLGLQQMGSISREWTNEKHSLYVASMEASFVRQLHSHTYHSIYMDMPGQHSRLRNLHDPKMSPHSNCNDRIPSSQFKVRQSGCWKKINLPAQPKMNTTDESRALVENQWIRHFRRAGKHHEPSLSSSQENSARSSESIFSSQNLEPCGAVDQQKAASCSEKRQDSYFQQRDKDSTSCNTEVSDQNFVNEDDEDKHTSDYFKNKKMKTAATGVLNKDQVVPVRNFSTTVDFIESPTSTKKESIADQEVQSENIYLDSSAFPE